MLLALTLLLLLLEQFVEADFLLRIQERAKLFPRLLQLLPNFWSHRLHDFLRTFLAGSEDFIDLLVLLGCQVQVPLDAAQKLDPNPSGRDGLNSICWSSRARSVLDGVFHQQATRHHSCTENHDRSKDNFPGIHQMASEAC